MSVDLKAAFDEVKDEISSSVKGRLGSPFVGVFIFAWIIWNHRFLFALFSEKKLEMRFGYIDEVLYPDVWSFLGLNFAGPLASAAVYIFAVPWITEFVIGWNLKMKRRVLAKEMESDGRNPLPELDSQQMRHDINDRNKRINEQREGIAKLGHKLSRSDAVVAVLSNSSRAGPQLKNFLCAGVMRLDLKPPMGGSRYEFEKEGHVKVIWEGSPVMKGAAKWRLDGMNLVVMNLDGAEIVTLEFDPSVAEFVERTGAGRRLDIS
ncbi:hypothetical protein [Stenotrophomonas maltophilia]|uniref:Transmembrane protein n=1 Tax=Stenotrophomonas maltophilia TaxID=40324 RepID=A0AAJ2JAX2_STEMA|nr:hypothetical protein [Stenotrophomonas maltophilia]MDT3468633.1 hypothetical protein [Stenotrophomonas maltophilia]